MSIRLHIDQLLLDGVAIPVSQQPALQAAVEAELSRLLTTHGLAPSLLQGGEIAPLQGPVMEIAPDTPPTQLGTQIAQAAFRRIGQ